MLLFVSNFIQILLLEFPIFYLQNFDLFIRLTVVMVMQNSVNLLEVRFKLPQGTYSMVL